MKRPQQVMRNPIDRLRNEAPTAMDSRFRGNDAGEGLGVPTEPERSLVQANSL